MRGLWNELAAIHVIAVLASYAPGGDLKGGEGRAMQNYSRMTVTVASLLFET